MFEDSTILLVYKYKIYHIPKRKKWRSVDSFEASKLPLQIRIPIFLIGFSDGLERAKDTTYKPPANIDVSDDPISTILVDHTFYINELNKN